MRKLLIAATIISSGYGLPAFSAESPIAVLKNISGKVLVNQGKGFVAAKLQVELKTGDKIMVGEDGTATVIFAEISCTVDLSPVAVTTITDASMCAVPAPLESSAALETQPAIIPAVGEPPAGGIPPGFIALGFIAVGAGALAVSESLGDDSTPVTTP